MEERTARIPSWLNDEFFKKIISPGGSNIDIIFTKIEKESEGNGCGSTYRVFIELMRESLKDHISFIVKAKEENNRENFSEKTLLKKLDGNALLILKMNNILGEFRQHFAPRLHYARNCSCEVLLQEDLEAGDFRRSFQSSGMDMKRCILITRKLAYFHASSVAVHQKHQDVMSAFKTSAYSEKSREKLEKIYPLVLKKLAEEAESWPNHKDLFALKLHNLANSAVDRILECVKTTETDFSVLCHGELIPKNIVFGYSEGSLARDEVRFLDFSSVHWGSPTLDFYRFIFSCASAEVLEWSQVLVEEYYSVLEEALRRLGYRQMCPSITNFFNMLNKRFMFGFILGLVDRALFLSYYDSVSLCDKDTVDFSNVEFSDLCKNVMKRLLFAFQLKGWL